MVKVDGFWPFQILANLDPTFTPQPKPCETGAGRILFHSAFRTGSCSRILRSFFHALPLALIDAARVEGVACRRIFAAVVLSMTMRLRGARWPCVHLGPERLLPSHRSGPGLDSQPVTTGSTACGPRCRMILCRMRAGRIVAALPRFPRSS